MADARDTEHAHEAGLPGAVDTPSENRVTTRADVESLGTKLMWAAFGVVLAGAGIGTLFAAAIAPSPATESGAVLMTEGVKSGSGLATHFNWLMFTLWSAPALAIGLLMLVAGAAMGSVMRGKPRPLVEVL